MSKCVKLLSSFLKWINLSNYIIKGTQVLYVLSWSQTNNTTYSNCLWSYFYGFIGFQTNKSGLTQLNFFVVSNPSIIYSYFGNKVLNPRDWSCFDRTVFILIMETLCKVGCMRQAIHQTTPSRYHYSILYLFSCVSLCFLIQHVEWLQELKSTTQPR